MMTYGACPSCLKLNKISLERAAKSAPTCGACGAVIDLHGAVLNVNLAQLEKLIAKSPIPVIADFWAPWCGPCRSFAPTFEQVAKEKTGMAVFVKLNTESHPEASTQFGIRGIPLLASFKNGTEKARQGGALPYPQFSRWVSEVV